MINAVEKLPDEPNPVFAGISVNVVISILFFLISFFNTSRIILCLIFLTLLVFSICEYLRYMPFSNGSVIVTKTYLSIAAEIKKPPFFS